MNDTQFIIVLVIGIVALLLATGVFSFQIQHRYVDENDEEVDRREILTISNRKRYWVAAFIIGFVLGYAVRAFT